MCDEGLICEAKWKSLHKGYKTWRFKLKKQLSELDSCFFVIRLGLEPSGSQVLKSIF